MAILDAPDVSTVQTPHGPVRVRDTGGNGAVVLLVHSLLLDPDLYGELTALLTARGYRCVVPELPLGGHLLPLAHDADLTPPGLARLLVEVLDGLGVARAHAVGVDTGGALVQLLMAHHRDRVSRVVLTGCDAYEEFPPTTPFGLAFRPLFWPGMLAVGGFATRARLFRRLLTLRPLTHRGAPDDVLVRWSTPWREPLIRRDAMKCWRDMHARHTLRAAELNRDFPHPVLVAWGDDDRAFRRSLAERLVADLPYARLVTLPDCAAFAALDQPSLLAQLVDEHVSAEPVPAPEGRPATWRG